MNRSFVSSLTGAGIGFLLACFGVRIASGGEWARDTGGAILLLGSFPAGAGAIAGAVIGGVADLPEYFQRKDQASDPDALKQREALK